MNFLNNLSCPNCHSNLKKEDDFLVCLNCSKKYKITNNIPDFRDIDEYWCNVSREKMQELNNMARQTNDWLLSAKKLLPGYSEHFIPFYRADGQFLWPTDKDSVILDAGSMWGGVTIPAAQYHKEVYAVDKTKETLEFLDIRARQMGFNNVYTIAASIDKLPFPDNFFDSVVLCGVLEWVALNEEITLEKQWQRTGRGLKILGSKKYSKNPTQMQLDVLKEINRVLKPNGSLCLMIENRIGYIYLAGWPDEHMNLPFVGYLPRFLANWITKLLLRSEYRTYVYTVNGYKKLFEKSGFYSSRFYGAFNHYINAKEIIPLELIKSLKKKIFESKAWQLRWFSKIIPAGLLPYLSPSIIAMAFKKDNLLYEPRIEKILRKSGLLKEENADFKAVKWNGRTDNSLPVNYLIYTDNTEIPTYFCKISRDKKSTESLKNEADNLNLANSFLKDTELSSAIPELVYYGTVDEITLLVTKHISGNHIKSSFWNYFKDNHYFPFLNNYATRRWLKEMNPIILKTISFLNDFQKISAKEKVKASDYIDSQISVQLEKLKSKSFVDESDIQLVDQLRQKIKMIGNEEIYLCFEHGDYDVCNILIEKGKINIVDFEHSQENKLPLFDLGNFIFSPLLLQWKKSKSQMTLIDFSDKYGWSEKIKEWIEYYSKISGISMDILKLLPSLSVLEQNAKDYPSHRNPYTYPMYGKDIIKQMLKWNL